MGENWTPSRRTVLRLGTAGLAGAVGYSASAAALENELRIAAVGESASYEFTVSGDLEAGSEFDPGSDSISGSSATGTIGGRGVDSFTFSGSVADFSSEGPLRVFLNGEEVDPDELGSGSDDEGSEDSARTELVVSDPDDGQPNDYRFTVSGAVERLDDPRGDSAEGDGAFGTVYGGSDGYAYSGEIVSFEYDGDLDVALDGEEVDPDTLGSGDSADDPAGDGDLPRTLRVEVVGESARFEFTVSGDLDAGPRFDSGSDSISGSSATGTIGGRGVDDFRFSGEISDFSSEGPLRAFVDGTEIDPASLGGNSGGPEEPDAGEEPEPSRTELVVSDPDGSQPNDYRFTVGGEVETLDDPRGDSAEGDTASGTVYGGADGYSYTGPIDSFEYDGDLDVAIDGEAVDPDTLGGGSDGGSDPGEADEDGSEPSTLRVAAVGESASYDLAVSGDLDAGSEFDPGSDSISGSSGAGTVGGRGVDSFGFSGSVTAFSREGPLRVFVNGEEVDPDELGSEEEDDFEDETDGEWAGNARLPRAQSAAGGGVLDGRLYYFGGFDSGPKLDATDRAFVYDPAAGSEGEWDRIPDMPARLWASCGVASESRIYSFGGAPPNSPYSTGDDPTDAVFAYTPGEGWRDLTAESGVRCPYPNWAMSGAYDPETELIYCVGGATAVTDRASATDHGTDSDSLGRYDEARIWTFDPDTETVADPDFARLPEGKRWATVGIVGGSGDRYLHAICGGRGITGPTDSNVRVDLESGRVERAQPAPRAGMFASTTNPVIDGEIYLTHGRFDREYTTRSYRYDPDSDEFEELAERPDHVRNRAVDGVIDGQLHVIGGHVKRYERDDYHDATTYNEVYTPPS